MTDESPDNFGYSFPWTNSHEIKPVDHAWTYAKLAPVVAEAWAFLQSEDLERCHQAIEKAKQIIDSAGMLIIAPKSDGPTEKTQAYMCGFAAREYDDSKMIDNPFTPGSDEFQQWKEGWLAKHYKKIKTRATAILS